MFQFQAKNIISSFLKQNILFTSKQFKQSSLINYNSILSLQFKSVKNYNKNLDDLSKLHPMPEREMLPEGEQQQYQNLDKNVTEQFEGYYVKQQRSCYVSVVNNGRIYHLFDASRISLGRMCAQMAYFLQGKHKPTFKNNTTKEADICVVVNASNIKMTGKKKQLKTVKYHSGYMGNLKEIPYKEFLMEKPEQLITLLTSRFLPRNMLRRDRLENLHIHRGPNHQFNFLPSFVPYDPRLDKNIYQGSLQELQKLKQDGAVVIYDSVEGGPEELKEFKRDYETENLVEDENNKTKLKRSPENKQVIKNMQKFWRVVERYREHPLTKPKDRNPKTNKDVSYKLITSELQARRWGLENELENEDQPEIEDESLPVK